MYKASYDFKPLDPLLTDTDHSDKAKVGIFEDHCLNYFVTPLMKCADSSSKTTIVAHLREASSALVAAPPVAFAEDRELHGEMVYRCLQVIRCLMHLLDLVSVAYAKDYEYFCTLGGDPESSSPTHVTLMPLIKSLPFWRGEHL